MQHLELNVVWKGPKIALIFGALAFAMPAWGQAIVLHSDPLLDGGPTTACAASADYAGGADVTGRPIVPADVAAAPVPVPSEMAVPLHGGRGRTSSPYVTLDGKTLDRLVNPPACH